MQNTIITITGPTCSGKTHLVRYLQTLGIHEVRSFTTRKPRVNEIVEGPDRAYDFITRAEAEELRAQTAKIIECVEFHGNIYGNTVEQRDEALALTQAKTGGTIACVVVEPNGVSHWREAAAKRCDFNVFAIYLQQPVEVLVSRFQERLIGAKDADARLYELGREERMRLIEHPTWGGIHKYDMVIENLDLAGGPTLEMFYGHLRFLCGLRTPTK